MTAVQHVPTSNVATTDGDDPSKMSHLIIGGVDRVLQARIHGLEVVALCGHRFVPQQNPDNFPLCQRCAELNDELPDDDDEGGRDVPGRWDGR